KTSAVTTATHATVTASYGPVTRAATVAVAPVAPQSLMLSPNPVYGGSTVMATVTLNAPAGPEPITVKVNSSNPALVSPAVSSITIPLGQVSGTFQITT